MTELSVRLHQSQPEFLFTSILRDDFRRIWSQSKKFRIVLGVVLLYLLLRVVMQGVILSEVILLGPVGVESTLISNDLELYLQAANRLQTQQDLYRQEDLDAIDVYQYAPSYALLFTALAWMPLGVATLIHTFLILGAYVLLYLWWGRIFSRLGLYQAREMLVWTLPIWLFFAAFWGDMAYLNIYVITALICTLLIDAILEERLGWSVLWLALILQTKPYLAFPLVLPLVVGRPRFFLKLFLLTILAYLLIVGGTVLAVGPAYGWEQQVAYFRFLAEMTQNFPWRGPDRGFLGYNHSILQIGFYFIGVTPTALRLGTGLKILLLIPLAVASLRHLLRWLNRPGRTTPQLSMDFAFALYAGALIWLDIVWEVTLGVVVFAYLLATLKHRGAKIWLYLAFLPYALLDVWQVVSFIIFGPDIILPGFYILTDPSIYIPMIMFVILTFYIILIRRLWLVSAYELPGL